jgi:hypothetical protein
MEGKAAVVVVLALVPRDGQRNIYRPEADLAERQIGKYRLGLGAKTIVKEAETMGLGRWTIETTDGSTAVAK